MAGSPFSVRVVAPTVLVLGVGVSTLFFARSQGWFDDGKVGSVVGEAVSAHDAAGVAVAPASGDVAALFLQRVEALQARLDEAPEDRDAILQLARLFHDGHQAQDAASLYRRALAMDPDDVQPYFDLASLFAETGDLDRSAAVLGELLVLRPGNAIALYNLGAVRANQGRIEEARQHLTAARATGDSALLSRIDDTLFRLGAR